jgi:hypothetical protein
MIPSVVPVEVGGAADGTVTCRAAGLLGMADGALDDDEPVTDGVGVVTDMIAATDGFWGMSQSSTYCRSTCCRDEWGRSVLTGMTEYCSQRIEI